MVKTTPLHSDFRDLISALNDERVEYVLVGSYALAAHGIVRTTVDIDFFFRATEENARRLVVALANFGYSSVDLTVESLIKPKTVHFFGRPPMRVDLLNHISGVEFEEAWESRLMVDLAGLAAPVIGLDCLVKNKRASGRPKDLVDVGLIESREATYGRESPKPRP